ncbi:MAG: TauD/TfdA family dioxygenase [Polyangiaceae bacterium]
MTAVPTATALHDDLRRTGFVRVVRPDAPSRVASDAHGFVEELLGERPVVVERHGIRAVPGGRTFASGTMDAPFHTDSQTFDAAPPHVQIMVCLHAARSGGESLALDAFRFTQELEAEEPSLFRDLFAVPRRMPFYFGDVFGPTIGTRGGGFAFTHTAFPEPDDPVAPRLARALARHADRTIRVKAGPGDVLVLDNRRMLHGRTAFDDPRREFVRLLVWLRSSFPAPERLARAERELAGELPGALASADRETRRAFGLPGARSERTRDVVAGIVSTLRGVSPARVSRELGIDEPTFYALRDTFLDGGSSAVESVFSRAEVRSDVPARAVLRRLREGRLREG